MSKLKNIVIVAGDESGDDHAAKLIQELNETNLELNITGIGGPQMAKAGATVIFDLAKHSVTGITGVFKNIKIIKHAFDTIKEHLNQVKPDLLILVDYPGFNLRLAKYAKRTLNLPILYYIGPQIWAWKAKRIHLIKECVDHMAVILPFEKAIYQKAQVPVSFVGHPLVEKMAHPITTPMALNLPKDKRVIALLPGSRRNEIAYHMPVLRDTVKLMSAKDPSLHFVIPIAQSISLDSIREYFSEDESLVSFVEGNAIDCMSAADFVIVASGTASLECALLEKPMCIIYKSSLLNYLIAMQVIRVKFLGLCNLLSNRMIAQEFLQYDCTPEALCDYVCSVLQSKDKQQHQIKALQLLKESLSGSKADCTLVSVITNALTPSLL